MQLDAEAIPYWQEYVFAKDLKRRWRADFFISHKRKLLIEVEGGVFSGGRHLRGVGYTKDIEKYNTAALLGFLVIRCTPEHIDSGQAMTWIKAALEVTS
jgi:hypothetical protein